MISEEQMLHGRPWRGEDVRGWYASEKLDGCRGYWDGARMWSRSGREIQIPPAWRDALPPMHLDGEVWAGRGQWETTVAAVARNQWAPSVCFMIFDAPEAAGSWSKRLAAASRRLRCTFAAVVPWSVIEDLEHASRMFRAVRLQGGEGLILRHPDCAARAGKRSGHVLKVKQCPLTGEMAWKERRRSFERAA